MEWEAEAMFSPTEEPPSRTRPLGLRGEQHWFSNREPRSFQRVLDARQSPKQRSWCLRQEEEVPWAVTSAEVAGRCWRLLWLGRPPREERQREKHAWSCRSSWGQKLGRVGGTAAGLATEGWEGAVGKPMLHEWGQGSGPQP